MLHPGHRRPRCKAGQKAEQTGQSYLCLHSATKLGRARKEIKGARNRNRGANSNKACYHQRRNGQACLAVCLPASQYFLLTSAATLCCSLHESGLWDYVIVNDTMEKTGQQLQAIAERALAGQVGNGIAAVPAEDNSTVVSPYTHASDFDSLSLCLQVLGVQRRSLDSQLQCSANLPLGSTYTAHC